MWLSLLVHAFRMWLRSRRDIRELAARDERSLRDIGVNRREIPRNRWDA
jgi:uncharacterized protein YjiS (DUF1127 family)